MNAPIRQPVLTLLLGVLLLALPGGAPATPEDALPPTVLHLATGSVGGTFLPVGHDLADWLEAQIPGLTVVVDTTSGSVDNLRRLVSQEADIAIVGASPFRKILEEGRRLGRGAAEICMIGTLFDDAEQYVVRASLVRAESMLDLNGLLMYPGPSQSGGEVDTRTLLEALAVEPRYVYPLERDKGYAEAAAALAAGEFDACTFSGGVPIQAVTDLFAEYPGEFVILPFSRHQISKVRHAALDFEPVIIPEGSYPGQDRDIVSVGGPNLLVAAPGLDTRILSLLDHAVRVGIRERGKGLRAAESHPVLQVLNPAIWDHVSLGGDCLIAVPVLPGKNAGS